MLENAETAAIAEAWASGAVAEWWALGGSRDGLAKSLDEHAMAAAVVGWIEGSEPPGGEGVLVDVGQHVPVKAWELRDPTDPSERGVIVTYEAPSGDRHDVSVSIIDAQLFAVTIGPEGLADAADGDQQRGLVRSQLDVGDAMAAIAASIGRPASDLTPMSEASVPLLRRRLDISTNDTSAFADDDAVILDGRDAELDRYAADVIRSALRKPLDAPAPASVDEAVAACRARLEATDPDAITVAEVAGFDHTRILDVDGLLQLVGAYLAPETLAAHSVAEQEALARLEAADWIGAILGLSRAPVGASVDGDMLVTAINRAPEITTSIPKRDAKALAWTFEAMLYAWEVTGVLRDGEVTDAAAWLLPRAAIAGWERSSH